MNREDVKTLFKLIIDNYPTFEVNAGKVDTWHEIMHDQNFNRVMHTAKEHIKKNKFPPVIADLYREVRPEHNKNVTKELEKVKDNALGYIPRIGNEPDWLLNRKKRAD